MSKMKKAFKELPKKAVKALHDFHLTYFLVLKETSEKWPLDLCFCAGIPSPVC